MTKTATLLGVLRAMFLRLCWHTQIMGRHQQRGTNSGRKSTLKKRDRRTLRRIVLKHHTTTATQVTGQQNGICILKNVSTKTVPCELHKFNIHGTAATIKPQITESNAQMRK
jgi:hypothetical protein